MPRCEACQRMQPSGAVRKMPGRDAHRCKDKFGCELARTRREPFTALVEITFPAKDAREAWQIVSGVGESMRPFPANVRRITAPDGSATRTKDEAMKKPAVVSSGPEVQAINP